MKSKENSPRKRTRKAFTSAGTLNASKILFEANQSGGRKSS